MGGNTETKCGGETKGKTKTNSKSENNSTSHYLGISHGILNSTKELVSLLRLYPLQCTQIF